MPDKRVRVGVKFGDTSVASTTGKNYTYLVPPAQAQIGQKLNVPVNTGHGVYITKATVVSTDVSSGVPKRPRSRVL